MLDWLTGRVDVPSEHDTALFGRIPGSLAAGGGATRQMSLIEKIKLAPDVSGPVCRRRGWRTAMPASCWPRSPPTPAREGPVLFVARDGQMIPMLAEIVRFAVPGLPILETAGLGLPAL